MDEVYAALVAADASSCKPGTAAACSDDGQRQTARAIQHNGFARRSGFFPLDEWRLS
jgi:acetaldehyde dehydrogenase (acetylating)